MLKNPKCRLCNKNLKHTDSGLWQCPKCQFYYQVTRGVPGRPIWKVAHGVQVEEDNVEALQEAFMTYLQGHGWTQESYEKLTEEGKKLLFDRWKATTS